MIVCRICFANYRRFPNFLKNSPLIRNTRDFFLCLIKYETKIEKSMYYLFFMITLKINIISLIKYCHYKYVFIDTTA